MIEMCYFLLIFSFRSRQRPGSSSEEPQGWLGYLSKAVSASASYLPTQVADVFSQGRAFATVHLPFQGIRNVCALATYVTKSFSSSLPFHFSSWHFSILIFRIQKQMRLLVASADGYVYIYAINPVEGGDCTLLKQHRYSCRVQLFCFLSLYFYT